jgi:hypothetical protein
MEGAGIYFAKKKYLFLLHFFEITTDHTDHTDWLTANFSPVVTK